MKLSELAAALGCALQGDGSLEITGVAGMEQATPSELTFLANPKYAPRVAHTRAGAVLTAAQLEGIAAAQLLSANPRLDFARALALDLPAAPAAPGHSPAGLSGALGVARRKRCSGAPADQQANLARGRGPGLECV